MTNSLLIYEESGYLFNDATKRLEWFEIDKILISFTYGVVRYIGTWAEYVARCQRWEDSQAKKEALIFEKEEKKKKIARKNLKNRSRCGSLARFWNYIHIIIWRMTSLTYGFALRMA